MKYLFVPVRSDEKISYKFEGETVIATINGKADDFDFSAFPDGTVEGIETVLPVNPIIEAKRENGVLSVKLLNYVGKNATYEERFPEWKEV